VSGALRRLLLLATLAWMACLFYLSNQPTLQVPPLFEHQDKMMHFVAYGLLGLLFLGTMSPLATGYSTAQAGWSTLLASLYGISDEFHQSFVPGRNPDVVDWAADTAGALLMTLTAAYLSRLYLARRSG
jgi:VanZ family protein